MNKLIILTSLLAVSGLNAGCSGNGANFSLLPSTSNFQQAALTKNKIDILFVVDNSGSMASSQQNLTSNIHRFVDLFNTHGFDYQMAVTTTDAYKVEFGAPASQSAFRDGTDSTSHTGYFLVSPATPNEENTFVTNAMQGTFGGGDERAFQSFRDTLNNPTNAGFPRPGAFLAVIILSDEDDFSNDGAATMDSQYNNPGLHTVASYVSFLDGVVGATAADRSQKYSVSSIAVTDQACLNQLNAQTPGRKIGQRYLDIASQTSGIVGSLCGDFGLTLSNISAYILNSITEFFLDRQPNVSTLRVYIGNVSVPMITDPTGNGFIYNSAHNSITFHGSFQPGPSESVTVKFDPTTIQ
jgi:hypothetical protein